MINDNIFINTNLSTNFKPKLIDKLKLFKKTNNIFCKNFLIYILLIKHQNKVFKKSCLFIKKYKKKTYTILRSPYRHKLARHQICIHRYNIHSSITINSKKIVLKNWLKLTQLLKFLKNLNKIFESNIIYTNNIKISLPFLLTKNFCIQYFKK